MIDALKSVSLEIDRLAERCVKFCADNDSSEPCSRCPMILGYCNYPNTLDKKYWIHCAEKASNSAEAVIAYDKLLHVRDWLASCPKN